MPSKTPNLRKYLKVVTLEVGGIQLLATIKNGLEFFQRKKLMKSTIIAEEELTHKVLAGFEDEFALSGLGRLLNMLLEEGVDALVTISAIANFDWMTMVAKMNAGTLSGVIAMNVEDSSMTWCKFMGEEIHLLRMFFLPGMEANVRRHSRMERVNYGGDGGRGHRGSMLTKGGDGERTKMARP